MLGLVLLQKTLDLINKQTAYVFAFNEQLQNALGIEIGADESTYVSEKKIWNIYQLVI